MKLSAHCNLPFTVKGTSIEMIDSRYTWLTGDLIENLVRKSCQREKVNIDSVHIEDAVARGENCSSCVSRIVVQYNVGSGFPRKLSFVQKAMPPQRYIAEEFEAKHIEEMESFFSSNFKKEIELYANIIPQINEALASVEYECESSVAPR